MKGADKYCAKRRDSFCDETKSLEVNDSVINVIFKKEKKYEMESVDWSFGNKSVSF
jgi:hypothetical protein